MYDFYKVMLDGGSEAQCALTLCHGGDTKQNGELPWFWSGRALGRGEGRAGIMVDKVF